MSKGSFEDYYNAMVSASLGLSFENPSFLGSDGGVNKANMAINAANNFYNSQQAQLARDWQEGMYLRYQSPQAMVSQYEEAGLNPALMYKDAGGGSIPVASSGASSATPLGMQNFGPQILNGISNLANAIAGVAKLPSSISNTIADTAGKRISNAYQPQLYRAQIDKIFADTQNVSADTYLKGVSADESIARKLLTERNISLTDTLITKADAEVALIRSEKWSADLDNFFKSITMEERVKFVQLQNDYTLAKTDEAKADAKYKLSEYYLNNFEYWYKDRYGTEIPNGIVGSAAGWVSSVVDIIGDRIKDGADNFKSIFRVSLENGKKLLQVVNNYKPNLDRVSE